MTCCHCNCAGNQSGQAAGNIQSGQDAGNTRPLFGAGAPHLRAEQTLVGGVDWRNFDGVALTSAAHSGESFPGGKDTSFKPQVWTGAFQSFPLALTEIARCTMNGLRVPGHTLHRWKEVPDGFKTYSEAHARHVLREAQADSPDEHFEEVVTVAWNALARLEHLCKDRDRKEG